MADLVEETVLAIRARMSELAPVVAEFERLQAASAALEGPGADSADQLSARAGARGGRDTGAQRGRGRSASRRSRLRAPRGQNKAAVYGVIAERPGVTVSEVAEVTGITKPLIYNTTRAGVERGELDRGRVAWRPAGVQGPRGGVGVRGGAGGELTRAPLFPETLLLSRGCGRLRRHPRGACLGQGGVR